MAYTHNEAYDWQGRQLDREILAHRELRSRELRSEERFQPHFLFAEDGSPLGIERFFDLVAERIVARDAA